MAAVESSRPRVRVLVVNHNAGPWLARCIESLRTQTMRDFEAVIVDNASTDGSFPNQLPDPRFRALRCEANLGFAVANNLAAQDARTPWLALLNPDAIAAPEWLASLLAEAEAHPDCRVFGSTQFRAGQAELLDGTGDCLSAWGISWRSGYGRARPADLPEGEVFAVCGAAMMISTVLFGQLGGFVPRFFCYVEDVDLCYRARLRGERVRQSARAQVQHAGGASSGAAQTRFSMYHGLRNLWWLHLRCTPWPWLPLALTGLTTLMLIRAVAPRRQGERPAMLRALRDALAGIPVTWRERALIQRERRVSAIQVARWLSWNPLDGVRRKMVIVAPGQKKARH